MEDLTLGCRKAFLEGQEQGNLYIETMDRKGLSFDRAPTTYLDRIDRIIAFNFTQVINYKLFCMKGYQL